MRAQKIAALLVVIVTVTMLVRTAIAMERVKRDIRRRQLERLR